MNKFIIFITLILATSVLSAPNPLRSLPALKHEHFHDEFGQYALRYVTAEGTIVAEMGKLVPDADGKGHVMLVEGEVQYVGDDGKTYVTKYTAGVDGVKMSGDHLPVAPIAVPVDSEAAALVDSADCVVVSTDATMATTESVSLPDAPAVPPMITAAV